MNRSRLSALALAFTAAAFASGAWAQSSPLAVAQRDDLGVSAQIRDGSGANRSPEKLIASALENSYGKGHRFQKSLDAVKKAAPAIDQWHSYDALPAGE